MRNKFWNIRARLFTIVILSLVLAMLANISHPCLFGPDEPREAEIAREMLARKNFVVPTLTGLPFLEKPPLYHDLIALSFALTGETNPTAARAISMLLGCLMLLAVFFFGYKWGGTSRGLLAAILLATIPRFYGYSHWILLDIGVGAFCTVALVAFAYWIFRDRVEKGMLTLSLFYLASTGAFLTKGVAGIFHVIVVVAAFVLLSKRWKALKHMMSPLPLMMFVFPVGLWLTLYYKAGGICFLHELFINNILGRFLMTRFHLDGCHNYNFDFGKAGEWYFYIKRFPEMTGVVLLFLPFAIRNAIKKIRNPRESKIEKNSVKTYSDSLKEKDILMFLLLWAFLPGFILSFSRIKEVSYLLPSYAAFALLAAGWLDEKLKELYGTGDLWKGAEWFVIVIPFVLSTILLDRMPARTYLIIMGAGLLFVIPFLLKYLWKKQFDRAILIALSIALSAVVVGNAPNVLYEKMRKRCYKSFAHVVLKTVGNKKLYLFQPNDYLRGSLAFYGNRLTPEIDRPMDLCSILSSGGGNYVLLSKYNYIRLKHHPPVKNFQAVAYPVRLPKLDLNNNYVLLKCSRSQLTSSSTMPSGKR